MYSYFKCYIFFSIFVINQCISFVYANDIAKEKYWKNILSQSIKAGQIVELKTDNSSFIGIYNKQNQLKEKGSVILLHDKAGHPNWKHVIKPLRIELSDYGWNTLSIQMPLQDKVLSSKAEVNAFYQLGLTRIDVAINFLKDKKAPVIMVIAYGSSTAIALNFVNKFNEVTEKGKKVKKAAALVLISAASKNSKQHPENMVEMLEKIELPILDMYGSVDHLAVLNTTKQRLNAAKRGGNTRYVQQQIDHADHFFINQYEILTKRIHSWMLSQKKK